MPNIIDANGLQVDTAADITAQLSAGFKGIYGDSINVKSNSPDGQVIGLLTQIIVNNLELLQQINAFFDPDAAQGVILDQRVTINNITRKGGTYTVQPISIVTNATVTLQGLDNNYSDPLGTGYTVQDSSGNQFILGATTTLTAGTNTLNFRAAQVGNVNVPINTITNPVTIIPGVVSVNNPTAAETVGTNEETDAQLRTRRAQSVANASSGGFDGLLGAVQNIIGVTEAKLYQNRTDITDANGIPPHCMWLIVAGGSNADIASVIYKKISDGCNMRGAVTQPVTKADGTTFIAKWDVPISQSLYIRFTIKRTTVGYSFALTAIKNYIAANLAYGIGEFAETSRITAVASDAIAAQGGGGVAVLVEISNDGITYTDYLDTTGPQYQFTVAAANIAISVV